MRWGFYPRAYNHGFAQTGVMVRQRVGKECLYRERLFLMRCGMERREADE